MSAEFFLYPLTPRTAARLPFPSDVPLDERDAYMMNPPATALAEAEVVNHPVWPQVLDEPPTIEPEA